MGTHTSPKNRHKARELALQLLYAFEQGHDTDIDELSEYLAMEYALSPENKNYGRELARAGIKDCERIDTMIRERAVNWDIKRMAAIDRNVVRMAVAELMHNPEMPAKVVIDESVELAKMYGTVESGKFVNGLVDSIYKKNLNNQQITYTEKDGEGNGTNRSSDTTQAE